MAKCRLHLAIATFAFLSSHLAAAARPSVGVTCCPQYKTYLQAPQTPTALISYPGSGNTWVRHIIETLTGYHTTSVYCDKTLVPVFKAECDTPDKYNQSIVVKTHRLRYCYLWKKAIVVVRNPLRSIRGEYQRMNTRSHTGYVDAKDWDWDDWYHVSTKMCRDWTDMFAAVFGTQHKDGCAQRPGYDMKVFFYEDLKTPTGALNPYFLDELLSYFKIPKDDSFYDCAIRNHKGSYARELPADHPAARLLNDTETLRRFDEAGCLKAYDSYRAKFAALQQPLESI